MIRIIARLDVKPPYVVKPVHFEGLRKIGSPQALATKYYQQGADEIIYVDIVASLYQREILYEEISNAARDIYIPFGVGGGVRHESDFVNLLNSGADKIIINTGAIMNPGVITQAAKLCGDQAVVVHIEAKEVNGWWECYTDCGRIPSGKNAVVWALEAQNLGAGEIMISSVDRDGRKNGFDIDLVREIAKVVKVPVIASSGAGTLEDIKKVILEGGASAVAIGSLLHYDNFTIRDIKDYLRREGVNVT